jgi:hypothetical protein
MYIICDNGTHREMTASEIAEQEQYLAAIEQIKQERELKATERQAVLDRLGITSEEAQLILGGSN